jgi:hypothetical protein
MQGGRSMRDFSRGRLWEQVRCLRNQFCRSDDLPFRSVLSTEMVAGVLAELRGTAVDCVYTPLTTLLVFLWQVLNADHSCRAAVAKLLAFRASRRQPPCSANTGAYCQPGRVCQRSSWPAWRAALARNWIDIRNTGNGKGVAY